MEALGDFTLDQETPLSSLYMWRRQIRGASKDIGQARLAFQPNDEYANKVKTIDDLSGHSLTAFYQEARLIGFQRR